MLKREIRKNLQDKKGKIHEKLVCVTLVKEDSIYLSIKCKNFKEPVLINVLDILAPYIQEENIKNIRDDLSLTCKKSKNKAS